jgi:3-phosphoglycerate kinase
VSAFRTLDEADVHGKRVLLRVDLNAPMEGGRVDARGTRAPLEQPRCSWWLASLLSGN